MSTLTRTSCQTYNDVVVDLECPELGDINIEDIAHALSLQCRYNGHTRTMYSVAQHSILVSQVIRPKNLALIGLLHDAGEAYYGDLIRPLKSLLRNKGLLELLYEAIDPIDCLIFEKFTGDGQADVKNHSAIKRADLLVTATEQRDLFGVTEDWGLGVDPISSWGIAPMESTLAEHYFLRRFNELR